MKNWRKYPFSPDWPSPRDDGK